jgi:hypothetical protein
MKRRKLLQHLERNGFTFHREGGRHTIYINVDKNLKAPAASKGRGYNRARLGEGGVDPRLRARRSENQGTLRSTGRRMITMKFISSGHHLEKSLDFTTLCDKRTCEVRLPSAKIHIIGVSLMI